MNVHTLYSSTIARCGIYPGTSGGTFFDHSVSLLESNGMTYCPLCDGEPWSRMRKCSCCSGTGLIEIANLQAQRGDFD